MQVHVSANVQAIRQRSRAEAEDMRRNLQDDLLVVFSLHSCEFGSFVRKTESWAARIFGQEYTALDIARLKHWAMSRGKLVAAHVLCHCSHDAIVNRMTGSVFAHSADNESMDSG